MPNVTITFNLPDERDEHFLATHGKDFWLALWDMSVEIRSKLKYGHDFKTVDEALEWVREQIPESIYDVE